MARSFLWSSPHAPSKHQAMTAKFRGKVECGHFTVAYFSETGCWHWIVSIGLWCPPAGVPARGTAFVLVDPRGRGRQGVSADELGVPVRRILPGPLQRVEIHADDAEAAVVAEGPVEVVQQRPDEMARTSTPASKAAPTASRCR